MEKRKILVDMRVEIVERVERAEWIFCWHVGVVAYRGEGVFCKKCKVGGGE